jgi:hypothetical protein
MLFHRPATAEEVPAPGETTFVPFAPLPSSFEDFLRRFPMPSPIDRSERDMMPGEWLSDKRRVAVFVNGITKRFCDGQGVFNRQARRDLRDEAWKALADAEASYNPDRGTWQAWAYGKIWNALLSTVRKFAVRQRIRQVARSDKLDRLKDPDVRLWVDDCVQLIENGPAREWCERVLKGQSAAAARTGAGITRHQWEAHVRPALRTHFIDFLYGTGRWAEARHWEGILEKSSESSARFSSRDDTRGEKAAKVNSLCAVS